MLMRSQPVTLLTRHPSPSPYSPSSQADTPVACVLTTPVILFPMSFQGRVGMIMWIVLIAKLMLLMMVGWEHYPNSDLSKWSPLAGPCMNISHWTAICLWLYLIAEMMILTMLVVFSIFSAGGHKGELSCKPYCQNDASGYCGLVMILTMIQITQKDIVVVWSDASYYSGTVLFSTFWSLSQRASKCLYRYVLISWSLI